MKRKRDVDAKSFNDTNAPAVKCFTGRVSVSRSWINPDASSANEEIYAWTRKKIHSVSFDENLYSKEHKSCLNFSFSQKTRVFIVSYTRIRSRPTSNPVSRAERSVLTCCEVNSGFSLAYRSRRI